MVALLGVAVFQPDSTKFKQIQPDSTRMGQIQTDSARIVQIQSDSNQMRPDSARFVRIEPDSARFKYNVRSHSQKPELLSGPAIPKTNKKNHTLS